MQRGEEGRIRAEHREAVRDILARLNASRAPEDMDLPGFIGCGATLPASGR